MKPSDVQGRFYDEDLGCEVPLEEYYNDPDKQCSRDAVSIVKRDLWGKFVPTWYQYEFFEHFTQRDSSGRLLKHLEGCAVVHRRAGKSTGVFKTFFLPWMLEERGTYHHAFPTLAQGKKAIWSGQGRTTRDVEEQAISYLELFPKELWYKKNNQDMSLELVNGSVYQLVGVRGQDGTSDHLLGLNTAGVVADECKDWKDGIIDEIFSPMLGQNGGPLFRIGTAGDENEFYEALLFNQRKGEVDTRHRAWILTVDDTYYHDGERIISEEYIQKQIEKGVDRATIDAHYYCKFGAAQSGAFYRTQMDRSREEKRICRVPYNPAFPVYSFWDLGVASRSAVATNAVWDAQFPDENTINLINYEQDPHLALWEFMVRRKKNLEYVTTKHYFPWDGNSPESTGMTKIEFCRHMGVIDDIEVIKRNASKQEGIDLTKSIFLKFYFDEVNSKYGITCLKNYSKGVVSATGEFVDPKKSPYNHGADAIRTLATAYVQRKVPIGVLRRNDIYRDAELYADSDEFVL